MTPPLSVIVQLGIRHYGRPMLSGAEDVCHVPPRIRMYREALQCGAYDAMRSQRRASNGAHDPPAALQVQTFDLWPMSSTAFVEYSLGWDGYHFDDAAAMNFLFYANHAPVCWQHIQRTTTASRPLPPRSGPDGQPLCGPLNCRHPALNLTAAGRQAFNRVVADAASPTDPTIRTNDTSGATNGSPTQAARVARPSPNTAHWLGTQLMDKDARFAGFPTTAICGCGRYSCSPDVLRTVGYWTQLGAIRRKLFNISKRSGSGGNPAPGR